MTKTPTVVASSAQAQPGEALSDMLCFDLYSMSRAMTGVYRPLLEPLGLTYPQFLVIMVLLRRGPGTIRAIGLETRLDHGTLTPMMRRLATRGLVSFGRGVDARTVVVSLTAAGERLRPEVDDIHCRITEMVGMTEEEFAMLQGALQHLAANLDSRVRPDES